MNMSEPFAQKVASALVAQMTRPSALLDLTGKVLFHNGDFADCLGRPEEGFIGRSVVGRFDAEARGTVKQWFADPKVGASDMAVSVEMPAGSFKLTLARFDLPELDGFILCQLAPNLAIDSTRVRFLLEHLEQGVWSYNVLTDQYAVTGAWLRMRGEAETTDVNAPGREILKEVHPEDRWLLRDLVRGVDGGEPHSRDIEYRRRHTDGHWMWIYARVRVMSRDHTGKPVQIVGIDTDITAIKQNQAELLQLSNKMQLAIQASGMGIWEYDLDSNTVAWDARMLEIYGLPEDADVRHGNLWETHLHPDDKDDAVAYSNSCLELGLDFERDYRVIRPTGEIRHVRSLARFVESAGAKGKLLGINLDVTEDYARQNELEAARRQLEYDSRHDALTGLANRRLLDETTLALQSKLGPDECWAVLHLDLDHFKEFNDSLGHAGGDALLVHLAALLRNHVGEYGLVCRVGGDEFVVLLERARSVSETRDLCARILADVANPIDIDGQSCGFSVSIGVEVEQGPTRDLAAVFINSDMALYAAKSDGRGCFRVFEPGMRAIPKGEQAARARLRLALKNKELSCLYQPQFDPHDQSLVGAEVLVRWNSPTEGLLLPGDFMPVARAAGLEARVDEQVLDMVLDQVAAWDAAGLAPVKLALNLSAQRLIEPGFLEAVRGRITPRHQIAFELLETSFWDDPDDAVRTALDTLRGLGIGIELDDFGAGHASVVALQALRPDRAKIDRMIVAGIEADQRRLDTLKALVSIVRANGCDVVIEGVENDAQMMQIRQLDCVAVQGFALGPPMGADQFEACLRNGDWDTGMSQAG